MKNGAVQVQTGLSLEGFLHQLPQEHRSLHLVTHVPTNIKGILKHTLAGATFFPHSLIYSTSIHWAP